MRPAPFRSRKRTPTPKGTQRPPIRSTNRERSSPSKLLVQKRSHVALLDAGLDDRRSDGAHQDKCKHSPLHFLVLANQFHDAVKAGPRSGNSRKAGRQTDLDEVALNPLGVARRRKTAARREFEGKYDT